MNLPRVSINNAQFTVLMAVLLTLLGIVSFLTMPRSEDPQFEFPITIIEVIYPGASPLDIESLVVDPLEEEINLLEDIKAIDSEIKNGGTRIEVEFVHGTDANLAFNDVKQAVASVKDSLPENVEIITVKATPNSVAVMQYALWSDPLDYRQMEFYGKILEKRIEALSEVQKADLWGYPTQIVSIEFEIAQLKHLNIPLSQVVETLKGRAINITPGFVDGVRSRFNIKSSGQFTEIEDIKNTIIAGSNASAIRLADVATVSFDSTLPNYLAYYDNKPVLFFTAESRQGENIFKLNDKMLEVIEKFKETLPPNIYIEPIFKQVDSVEKRVNGFFDNFLQGLIFVGFMTLIFLGFKESFIVILAVPLSVFIAIGWLDFAGFGLQQMSIVGLIIALGLLVDDAIVVTESIHRFKVRGHPPAEAAAQGANQVALASASGTVTTMLAFLPMLLLFTTTGDFMRAMPVTVVLVLAASLLVSLTVTPLIASKMAYNTSKKDKSFQHYTNWFAEKIYAPTLAKLLQRKSLVIIVALLLLAVMGSLFGKVGVSLFPKAEKPMLMVEIETPANASIPHTDKIVRAIATDIEKETLVKSTAINIGNANPRIYYNEMPVRGLNNFGQILVLLNDYDSEIVGELVTRLRNMYKAYPHAIVNVREFKQGPVTDKPITFRIYSERLEDMEQVANALANKMRATEGIINIDNPIGKNTAELSLHIDYDKAALSGVDIHTLDSTLKAALTGEPVGTFNDINGEEYPIVVRQKSAELEHLEQLNIANAENEQIPLASFVEPKLNKATSQFYHYKKLRMAKVSADADIGYSINELTTEMIAFLNSYDMPAGVYFEVGGEEENRQESFSGLTQIMLITGLGILAVLILQFKSVLQPVIIFSAIPFAIVGSVLGLYVFNLSFSLMAFIGLISLFGIVVNNAIILVDCTNMFIRQGQDKELAVKNASATRFTPILLTTLTTIGGLIPLTLFGGVLWQPLGLVIISGLIVSSFSSLLVVPVLTVLFTPVSKQ